ncbi:MAG: phosphatase PAP2 family protein [Patescibacteria group bacterium]
MDLYIFQWINNFAGKNICLNFAVIFFAEYYQFFVVFFLSLFLLKDFRKYSQMVATAIAAAVFSRFILTEIIRYLMPRARIFTINQVNLLVAHNPNESSFPSGHTALFFALATVVYFYNKKAGIFFYISAFFIGISRVFAGLHWPSDIVAGIFVGIFSGWLVYKFQKRLLKQKIPR